MIPELILTSGGGNDRPLVYVVSSAQAPEFIDLSDHERELVARILTEGKNEVFLYTRQGYLAIVRVKGDLPEFRQHEEMRGSGAVIAEKIREAGLESITVTGDAVPAQMVAAFTEGLVLASYRFDKYITRNSDKKKPLSKVTVSYDIPADDFEWLRRSCEALYLVRDMINEPPRRMTAQIFAEAVKNMSHAAGFTAEVLDRSRIAALRMGGLLGVNNGSIDPPEFCILEHKPAVAVNKKPLVLIGKGVVLDTGGLNLKNGSNMELMKTDMAGGAAVAGVMYLLSATKVPLHVIALIPVTDNRPGQNALAPGDVLAMYNGTTVEVANTDAEGRIILADAISYSSKFDPMLVVSIATLTGSAAMTFNIHATAMMGNAGDEYMNAMEASGEEVYERVARLPFWDEYGEAIKSDIADVKNVGSKDGGGAIAGGKFLETFTSAPFIHLDIAGPGMLRKNDKYRTKDGPGTGVRLLASFARRLASGVTKKI